MCSVGRCDRQAKVRGWCKRHYDRVLRLGTTDLPTFAQRFWAKSTSVNGCWVWTGGKQSNGYGSSWNPRLRRPDTAHRVAWELTHGPVPAGKEVRHRCDNPPCCRPDHLELGSHADNMRDTVVRRRAAAGERQGSAKLTDEIVSEMRASYANGMVTQRQLAERYEVSPATVSMIVRGRTWKHLPLATERMAS